MDVVQGCCTFKSYPFWTNSQYPCFPHNPPLFRRSWLAREKQALSLILTVLVTPYRRYCIGIFRNANDILNFCDFGFWIFIPVVWIFWIVYESLNFVFATLELWAISLFWQKPTSSLTCSLLLRMELVQLQESCWANWDEKIACFSHMLLWYLKESVVHHIIKVIFHAVSWVTLHLH